MSQTARQPRAYHSGPWERLVDGFRYGGGLGQWAWLAHRVTGLGILLYLVIHIFDTFFVVVNPAMYDHALALYGGWTGGGYYWPLRWAFRFGELGLFACVLFHALNGLRVIAFDFFPSACQRQKLLFRLVVILFLAVMVPAGAWIVWPLGQAPPARPEHGEPADVAATAPAR